MVLLMELADCGKERKWRGQQQLVCIERCCAASDFIRELHGRETKALIFVGT
jgi:hypothetical protein